MRSLVLLFLINCVTADIVFLNSSSPSRSLLDVNKPLKATFTDFDKTLAVMSFGSMMKAECERLCNCSLCGPGMIQRALQQLPNPTENVTAALGGAQRLVQLKALFRALSVTQNFMVSTSWDPISALDWQEFLSMSFNYVGLSPYLPIERILTLNDPPPEGGKGAVIRAKMRELGIQSDQALFSDDGLSNIESAVDVCDYLYVNTEQGLTTVDFGYIQVRARGLLFPKSDQFGAREASIFTYDHDWPLMAVNYAAVLILGITVVLTAPGSKIMHCCFLPVTLLLLLLQITMCTLFECTGIDMVWSGYAGWIFCRLVDSFRLHEPMQRGTLVLYICSCILAIALWIYEIVFATLVSNIFHLLLALVGAGVAAYFQTLSVSSHLLAKGATGESECSSSENFIKQHW